MISTDLRESRNVSALGTWLKINIGCLRSFKLSSCTALKPGGTVIGIAA